MQITCPSGLTVTLRKMKIKEMNILASSKSTDQNLNKTLDNTTVSVDNYGPYDPENFKWSMSLSADRSYAYLMLRSTTVSDEFLFNHTCPHCRSDEHLGINLTDISVTAMSDVIKDKFASGQDISIQVGEDTLFFKPLTASSEKLLEKFVKQYGELTGGVFMPMATKVVTSDGKTLTRRKLADWFDDLDVMEGMALKKRMAEGMGFIDLDVRKDCDNCGKEFKAPIPLSSATFWGLGED